jgi:hypothetical protein
VEGRPLGSQRVDDRLVRHRGDLSRAREIEARHRGVAAHAAGVRALVAVEDALVVLRRRQRHGTVAVAERQQRHLLPVEELLQHHLGLAEPPLAEEHVEGGARLALVGGDDHALARGQHVGLEYGRVGGAGEVRRGLLAIAEDGVRRRRHPAALHQLLRIRLRSLDAGGRLRRPERGDARLSQVVDEPGHQRRLGPHHDQVDPALARERDEVGVRDALHAVGRDPRVTGRRDHLGRSGAAQQRADERMLAPAPAYHEHPRGHG